jgi:PGAP1-like protein
MSSSHRLVTPMFLILQWILIMMWTQMNMMAHSFILSSFVPTTTTTNRVTASLSQHQKGKRVPFRHYNQIDERTALFTATTSTSSTPESAAESTEPAAAAATTTTKQQRSNTPNKKVAVLLCPAQFCVPDDYEELWQHLPETIEVGNDDVIQIDRSLCRTVPLSRRDWIKVSKQLPTADFWNAQLQVHKTLDWYFEKVEQGIAEILQKDPSTTSICLVGHSIGGWVARAYLGGLAKTCTALEQTATFSSLITLGTPHICPTTALVDQTRGLLQEIATTPACSSQSLLERNIDVTCVCSDTFAGNFLSTDIEQLVAASSYWPLLGRSGGDVLGDGIVPLDVAFMEAPARRIVLNDQSSSNNKRIRHSHVLPTPWNLWNGYAPSIPLDDTNALSYVSPEIVPLWSRYIR